MKHRSFSPRIASLMLAMVVGASTFSAPAPALAAAAPLPIVQVPLTSPSPIRPQVLFAVGNSESMDGTLSGAIMTGSGAQSGNESAPASLLASSSPADFAVPAGFTPPLAAGSGGQAPITVVKNGVEYDNSASRLNVAKGSVRQILSSYLASTDFALEDYATSNVSVYQTWVYYMSNPGGFVFTNTPSSGGDYVANPCYGYGNFAGVSDVQNDCYQIDQSGLYGGGYGSSTSIAGASYLQIAQSSDDPDINDVLYAYYNNGQEPSVNVGYGSISGYVFNGSYYSYAGAINPPSSTPYTVFNLSEYNSGSTLVGYSNSQPWGVSEATSPTNAGFVPFSPQVMYSYRGFGYGASQSASSGRMLVPMTSAGQAPTTTSVNTALAVFTPYLAPETDQAGTSEIKAEAGQSPLGGLLSKALDYYQNNPNPSGYTSAQLSGCGIQKYVILITDGLPTEDNDGNFWPPLGSAAAAGYGVSATFDPSTGALKSTNDQALTDTINAISALQKQGIETFVVGLGAGVDPSLNNAAAQAMNAMAVAGGTYNPGFNAPLLPVQYAGGTLDAGYLAATSPAALVTDLNQALIKIQAGAQSTTSAAVNSATISTDTSIYQTTYTSSNTPYSDWTGNLLAFKIGPTGQVNTSPSSATWQAQYALDQQVCGSPGPLGGPHGGPGGCSNDIASRLIATFNPQANAGAPFEWSNLSSAQQSSLGSQNMLDYLRGDTALEQRNGGTYRNRSYLLGDIVDSNPVYVGVPDGPYQDASYAAFIQAEQARTPILYVGANDGMMHGFNANNGSEAMAYVPDNVMANLPDLAQPLYNQQHHYFVDGSPTVNDVLLAKDGKWHTELVSGEGGGGSSVFALDVTTPPTSESQWASDVLWEYNANGSDPNMGLTYSQPIIARIAASTVTDASNNLPTNGFAVFFGNGYDSANEHAVLYALHAGSGSLIREIDLCNAVAGACNPNVPDGLSSVVAANDNGLLGGVANHVFAGDLQGNLWSINVSSANPSLWTVRLLFKAEDASGNPQPITVQPTVSLNPSYPNVQGLMVYFGTGELLNNGDLSSNQVQSFYGVLDRIGATGTYTRSNLVQQTITDVQAGTLDSGGHALQSTARTSTDYPVNYQTQDGWYFDLPGPIGGNAPSERDITNPLVDNGGIVFTTYTPAGSGNLTCNSGGVSFLMDVNFATGGAFSAPRLGLGLNGAFTSVNGSAPTGTQVSGGYLAAPTVLGNPFGGADIYTPASNLQIPMTIESYGGHQIVGWLRVL